MLKMNVAEAEKEEREIDPAELDTGCQCGSTEDELREAYECSLDPQGRSGPASARIADHAREHGIEL